MILIDYKDSRPIYEQVFDKLRLLILNGNGKKIHALSFEAYPHILSLMQEGIIDYTIGSELERQGYIYTVKGRGNFVSDTGQLKNEYRREIFGRLDEVITAADNAGMSRSELVDHIKSKEEILDDRGGEDK